MQYSIGTRSVTGKPSLLGAMMVCNFKLPVYLGTDVTTSESEPPTESLLRLEELHVPATSLCQPQY